MRFLESVNTDIETAILESVNTDNELAIVELVSIDKIVQFGCVVVLTPEERDSSEFLVPPKHVACRGLPLTLGHHPMLDTNALAAVGIGPTRNVACCEDPWRARLEVGVHNHTAIHDKTSRFSKLDPRTHSDSGNCKVGGRPWAECQIESH